MVTAAITKAAASPAVQSALVGAGTTAITRLTDRQQKANIKAVERIAAKQADADLWKEFIRLCREQPMLMSIICAALLEVADRGGLISNEFAALLQGAIIAMGVGQAMGGGIAGSLAGLAAGAVGGAAGYGANAEAGWDWNLLQKIPVFGTNPVTKVISDFLPIL